MENDLKGKTISGIFWKFMERIGAKVISSIVSIVLARLLLPEDYAAIALVMVFINLSDILINSGFSSSLVQKKDADDVDFSSVFYISLILSIVLYIVIFICAPLISVFYDMPILTPVTRVIGIKVIISAINATQQAYVSREMTFKKFFFATLIGTLISAFIGIIMAYNGLGVWALVTQHLSNLTIDTIVLWFTVKWRPQKTFSFKQVKKLLNFGWKILASDLLNAVFNDLRTILIGKSYSADQLAYYSKGKEYPNTIVTSINSSLNMVLFSAISKEQENIDVVKLMVRRSLKLASYIIFPVMIGFAAVAESFVHVFLTEKWLTVILFLQVYCFAFAFSPLLSINLQLIKAMGRSDLSIKIEIIKKIVGLAILCVTLFIGVEAIAIGSLVSQILYYLLNSFPNKKLIKYSVLEQLKDIFPNFLISIIMFIAVYSLGFLMEYGMGLMILQISLGVLVYLLMSLISKNESFFYILNMVKNKFIKK
ncbi:MAG: lipopolysaccharide biosynthesis protein [Oscillospiraceae bacterium]|nr:lipopolysaccharide biosynthesis protein [Oscillospiraceae bacterium]